ncbi:bidirectional sugar transporter SWEET2-like [Hibiscus syriacus]|uniref:bidirectional sugar transporter SWEET2-like n=1 Tax=Hibiscus syriacus TaxID=106335 RepID=UPI001921BD32|nr:bidirectional sugar transporter SWEET2-like [Hibiscus syriacus]
MEACFFLLRQITLLFENFGLILCFLFHQLSVGKKISSFMFLSIRDDTFTICRDAAGIAGNIFAFGLFVSPIPTFKRIVRNKSTESFSGLPCVYALLNCLICTWYGTPLISYDNVPVMMVNSIGSVFQITYIVVFIVYANREKKFLALWRS